jgi:hypothetical protein
MYLHQFCSDLGEINWPEQFPLDPIKPRQAPAGSPGHATDWQFPNAAAFAEYSNMDVAPSILIGFL